MMKTYIFGIDKIGISSDTKTGQMRVIISKLPEKVTDYKGGKRAAMYPLDEPHDPISLVFSNTDDIDFFIRTLNLLKTEYKDKNVGNDTIHSVSTRFYIGCEICLKSNEYSTGVIIDKARKRDGNVYWKVEWDDGEITKVAEYALNVY